MEVAIITTATQLRGVVIGLCPSISMFQDVSLLHHVAYSSLLTYPRPPHIRSADVWNLPATEENAAYQDHADVVQEVVLASH